MTLEDTGIPRGPIDPATLKPEQIRHIRRKVRGILFGMILKTAPLLSLLLASLRIGLLAAIPIYLGIRLVCLYGQVKREDVTMSRKRVAVELVAFLLGGISLATWDPIWFKLEITLIAVLAGAAWIASGLSPLADTEPFPPASIIGEKPARAMRYFFIASLAGAPVLNLWLALQSSDTTWLLFRTVIFFLWIATFAMLGTWLAARRAEQTAS
ncbi:hypothetical protein [Taklimakanibacter lacteus]|uniref:hypothetical protein n=1 Tax=Taklimakanibacter lacteus TaxID=2268456 RepID=UPI000E66B5EC